MSDIPEITTEQIVARLRMIVAEPDSLCKTDFYYIEDAADEIELLRSAVTDCRIEIERTRAERDEAKRQRDQARRTLCKVLVMTRPPNSMQSMRGFAKEMGWDCFPQEDGK